MRSILLVGLLLFTLAACNGSAYPPRYLPPRTDVVTCCPNRHANLKVVPVRLRNLHVASEESMRAEANLEYWPVGGCVPPCDKNVLVCTVCRYCYKPSWNVWDDSRCVSKE